MGDCDPIEVVANTLGSEIELSAASEWPHESGSSTATAIQPVRVSYAYDPLQQLTDVSYPLAGQARAHINVRYDLLGRMRELHEPNSGCTSYQYDPLNLLVSVRGSKFEAQASHVAVAFRLQTKRRIDTPEIGSSR